MGADLAADRAAAALVAADLAVASADRTTIIITDRTDPFSAVGTVALITAVAVASAD